MKLWERVAETFGVSGFAARVTIAVTVVLLIVIAIVVFVRWAIWFTRSADYNYYRKEIPETESKISNLRYEIYELERDLANRQQVIDEKVLRAVEQLDESMLDEDVRWLVKTCEKVDTKKIRQKLNKKYKKVDKLEEWLRNAREEYAALSRKLKRDL